MKAYDWAFLGIFSMFALETGLTLKDRFVAWIVDRNELVDEDDAE